LTPQICLITACLNEAAEISRHIAALRQSCCTPGLSMAIVDGGSTDGTATHLRESLSGAEVSFLPGSGIYEAWNHAIATHPGTDYFCFLGVGDRLEPQGLGEALALIASTAPDIVYGPVISNSGKLMRPVSPKAACRWRWGRLPFCHAGTLFSAELFQLYGLFDPSYRIGADLEWMLRAGVAAMQHERALSFGCTTSVLATMRRGGISCDPAYFNRVISETQRAHEEHQVPISLKRTLVFRWRQTRLRLFGAE
jgi:glycosyltransferase involved in cell wall biosynthesis